MKYLFYAIVFDVAGNTTAVGNSASPAKTITTNIQNVTGISINPSSAQTKNIGENFTITATVSPSDANNKSVNWSSSNSGISTVDSSGNVRCVSAGEATITATATDGSGKSASLSLTVYEKITITTFNYSSTNIDIGKTSSSPTVNITGTAKSGPTYMSSNPSIATVNSTTGIISGISNGDAIITVSYTNYDGTISSKICYITIKALAPTVIIKPTGTLVEGNSPYIAEIALPSPNNHSSGYYGIIGEANDYALYVKFTQNVSSVIGYYGSSSSYGTTKTDCSNSNNNSVWSYYQNAFQETCIGGQYEKFVITLSGGNTVTIETIRAAGSEHDQITYVKIS